MPILLSTYRCPWFLRNGHVQTIWPTLYRKVAVARPVRIRINTADDDFLDLDHYPNRSARLAILSHGLEGNSDRHYIKGMAGAFLKRKWDVMAWNSRGCSGEPNRQLRFYHSGATEDLDTVVRYALGLGLYREIGLVGFSLGGNLTLKYVGERGSGIDPRIRKAVAFSVPCNLGASSGQMGKWYNRHYMKRFLNLLHDKIREKMVMFPGQIDDEGYDSIRDFHGFDNRYTAPLHGFKDAQDYWNKNSCKQFLPAIALPTLIVSALDDPFLTDECFPTEAARSNPNIFLEMPNHGGHVGFMNGRGSGEYWSEARAVEFLEMGSIFQSHFLGEN